MVSIGASLPHGARGDRSSQLLLHPSRSQPDMKPRRAALGLRAGTGVHASDTRSRPSSSLGADIDHHRDQAVMPGPAARSRCSACSRCSAISLPASAGKDPRACAVRSRGLVGGSRPDGSPPRKDARYGGRQHHPKQMTPEKTIDTRRRQKASRRANLDRTAATSIRMIAFFTRRRGIRRPLRRPSGASGCERG